MTNTDTRGWMPIEPLPEDLHDPLHAWAFNTMLECSQAGEVTMALGGAVVDFRDLERILNWAVNATAPDRLPHLPEPTTSPEPRA